MELRALNHHPRSRAARSRLEDPGSMSGFKFPARMLFLHRKKLVAEDGCQDMLLITLGSIVQGKKRDEPRQVGRCVTSPAHKLT